MKKQIIYLSFCILTLLVSCSKVELGNVNVNTDGLMSFVVVDPKSGSEYRPMIAGPYEDGATITISIPSPIDNPVDLTQLKAYCSLQNDCEVVPALPTGIIDFTEPYAITVKNAKGELKKNYIAIELVKPKVGFERLWFMPQSELQLAVPGWYQSIDVTEDYILVHDAVGFDPTNAVRVYDRTTRAFVKSIPTPATVTRQVRVVDGDNFIITRCNESGAGFMVYLYEGINDDAPSLLLNYSEFDGCPLLMGKKVSVAGSLKTGMGYIHATALDGVIYRWAFSDGVLATPATEPEVIQPGFGSSWGYASARWLDGDINKDMFITHYTFLADDLSFTKGSRIAVVTKNGEKIEMDKNNHLYRVFDMQPFILNGDVFLAITQQALANYEPTSLRVFDVTNREDMKMTLDMENYDKFMLFQSANLTSDNYTGEGDVVVYVEGNVAYIYQAVVASTSTAGIAAYKMTYYTE